MAFWASACPPEAVAFPFSATSDSLGVGGTGTVVTVGVATGAGGVGVATTSDGVGRAAVAEGEIATGVAAAVGGGAGAVQATRPRTKRTAPVSAIRSDRTRADHQPSTYGLLLDDG